MRAVIFDLDGTLADTVDDIHASMNQALAGAGLGGVAREKVLASVGGGVVRLIERIVDDVPKRDDVHWRFREHYGANLLVKTRLYPGAREALDALRGEPMAVLSNKPESMTKAIVEGLGIAGHFGIVVGGDSLPVKKPDPSTVKHVLKALGVADGVLVGDSRYDVETARNAGISVVAVTWGYSADGDLAGADYIAGAFPEVVEFVRRSASSTATAPRQSRPQSQ